MRKNNKKREKKNNVKKIIAIYKLLKELKFSMPIRNVNPRFYRQNIVSYIFFLVKCLFMDEMMNEYVHNDIFIAAVCDTHSCYLFPLLSLIFHFCLCLKTGKKKSLEIDDFSSVFKFELINGYLRFEKLD